MHHLNTRHHKRREYTLMRVQHAQISWLYAQNVFLVRGGLLLTVVYFKSKSDFKPLLIVDSEITLTGFKWKSANKISFLLMQNPGLKFLSLIHTNAVDDFGWRRSVSVWQGHCQDRSSSCLFIKWLDSVLVSGLLSTAYATGYDDDDEIIIAGQKWKI